MPKHVTQALRDDALDCCKWRGHTMVPVLRKSTNEIYECKVCGAYMQILASPAPNQIDIGGPAVALTCPIKEGE